MDIVAGIDAGTETFKLVLLADGRIALANSVSIGTGAVSQVATDVLCGALAELGLSAGDVRLVAGTGVNVGEAPYVQEEVPEAAACCAGIEHISSGVCTVVDIGASKYVAIKCRQGRPVKIISGDKCAASVGLSLRMAASVLSLNIEDIGRLSLSSTEEVSIQSTCSVFVETEIISLLHHYKKKPPDILRGVFQGMASRFYSSLLSVGIEGDIYMVGGVARNVGVVRAMEDLLKRPIIIPPDPDTIGALGAALSGQRTGDKN